MSFALIDKNRAGPLRDQNRTKKALITPSTRWRHRASQTRSSRNSVTASITLGVRSITWPYNLVRVSGAQPDNQVTFPVLPQRIPD